MTQLIHICNPNGPPCLLRNYQMKADNQRDKELFTLVPSQISPNPLRRNRNGAPESPLSENSQPTSFSSSSNSSVLCAEPVINFENLLSKRHGSVLGHDIILKSEHFFKGKKAGISITIDFTIFRNE